MGTPQPEPPQPCPAPTPCHTCPQEARTHFGWEGDVLSGPTGCSEGAGVLSFSFRNARLKRSRNPSRPSPSPLPVATLQLHPKCKFCALFPPKMTISHLPFSSQAPDSEPHILQTVPCTKPASLQTFFSPFYTFFFFSPRSHSPGHPREGRPRTPNTHTCPQRVWTLRTRRRRRRRG